jgi:hypothetical protein
MDKTVQKKTRSRQGDARRPSVLSYHDFDAAEKRTCTCICWQNSKSLSICWAPQPDRHVVVPECPRIFYIQWMIMAKARSGVPMNGHEGLVIQNASMSISNIKRPLCLHTTPCKYGPLVWALVRKIHRAQTIHVYRDILKFIRRVHKR